MYKLTEISLIPLIITFKRKQFIAEAFPNREQLLERTADACEMS
jgi:hypothetical protein